MFDKEEDEGLPLSPKVFIKKMQEEISSLTRSLIKGCSLEQYHEIRGRILQTEKVLEIFINKKS